MCVCAEKSDSPRRLGPRGNENRIRHRRKKTDTCQLASERPWVNQTHKHMYCIKGQEDAVAKKNKKSGEFFFFNFVRKNQFF
jgi:hypothetical protein